MIPVFDQQNLSEDLSAIEINQLIKVFSSPASVILKLMNAYPLSSCKSMASIKWRKNPDLFIDRHPQRETRKFYRGVNRNAGRDQINPGSSNGEPENLQRGLVYLMLSQGEFPIIH